MEWNKATKGISISVFFLVAGNFIPAYAGCTTGPCAGFSGNMGGAVPVVSVGGGASGNQGSGQSSSSSSFRSGPGGTYYIGSDGQVCSKLGAHVDGCNRK